MRHQGAICMLRRARCPHHGSSVVVCVLGMISEIVRAECGVGRRCQVPASSVAIHVEVSTFSFGKQTHQMRRINQPPLTLYFGDDFCCSLLFFLSVFQMQEVKNGRHQRREAQVTYARNASGCVSRGRSG